MASAVFVSDLHLAPEYPETAARFLDFLHGPARQAERLYILGDLFEVWIGDDELDDPLHARVVGALRLYSDAGHALEIMHGNRDFLLGDAFFAACGARPLADPSVIELGGAATLLMHGDSLCIDDQAYLDFRDQVRDPAWQRVFLAKPRAERRDIARKYRADSRDAQTGKSATLLDVNPEAVRAALRASGCRRMIHGHTHRAARHVLSLDGETHVRWVLPDWYGAGGYLACQSQGCALRRPDGTPLDVTD
jgi:UDP-2,3-diacylglucosamine hydrolase